MIIYKKEMVEHQKLDKFICDKCKKEVEHQIELQETCSIRFQGGYSSVFGDGANIAIDLCQRCLFELCGDFCQFNSEE